MSKILVVANETVGADELLQECGVSRTRRPPTTT